MQSAVRAIAWEFWGANRRGWLLVLAALVACGVPYRIFAESLQHSEGIQFLSYMPLTAAITVAVSFCNFTDRRRRDGLAGFPRHLFVLPVSTGLAVTCAMVCSLLSVVGIYVAWTKVVMEPLEVEILVRWPATLLAAFVVFYQAIIWCLSGFRLTRVIGLSLVATALVAVGFLPTLLPKTSFWSSEAALTAAIGALMAVAYAATLVTVGAQRRGGARGWAGVQTLVERLVSAIPHRRVALESPDAALYWMERRRTGFVLPTAVLLTTVLILGPVLWFTGRSEKEMVWAEMWLAMMPILLAFPIGLGFGKPDFWSLELALSPFIAARPVTASQLLAAKMKAAAFSALVAWGILLVVAPTCIYWWCDTKHLSQLAGALTTLYSPISQCLVPILALVGAVLLTWILLVPNLWLGYSGRAGFYYSLTGIGLTAFVAGFFFFVWWQDHPRNHGDALVGMLPWLPWALAAMVSIKAWSAIFCARELRRRRLLSDRDIAAYVCGWLGATACLVLGAWLISGRIEWFGNMAMLAACCAMPVVSIAITPLTIAWNRHR